MNMMTTAHSPHEAARPEKLCVQYGCGLSAPVGWMNFDSSPTLRLQRLPVVGPIITRGRVQFPKSVLYGDVVRGLPIKDGSCDAVFASHVLEHLALNEFHTALQETLRILRVGGRFRLIVPDLEALAREYLEALGAGNERANGQFMRGACLGKERRPRSPASRLLSGFGNSDHLWMWDRLSIRAALDESGFESVRQASPGDSDEPAFCAVEDPERFEAAIAFEAVK